METKKVTMDNGTVLEVGKKYKQIHWTKAYFEVLSKGNNNYFGIMYFEDGNKQDRLFGILDSCIWLPHTTPTPQKDWKTFMIEIDWNGYTSREIVQCESLEIAKQHYNNAISIQEVKLNIEPVNS